MTGQERKHIRNNFMNSDGNPEKLLDNNSPSGKKSITPEQRKKMKENVSKESDESSNN